MCYGLPHDLSKDYRVRVRKRRRTGCVSCRLVRERECGGMFIAASIIVLVTRGASVRCTSTSAPEAKGMQALRYLCEGADRVSYWQLASHPLAALAAQQRACGE